MTKDANVPKVSASSAGFQGHLGRAFQRKMEAEKKKGRLDCAKLDDLMKLSHDLSEQADERFRSVLRLSI